MNNGIHGAWLNAGLTTLYTLTPLHVGSGEASGGVDLPIVRDTVTDFPLIPATALKGVAREIFEQLGKSKQDVKPQVERLFGPMVTAPTGRNTGSAGEDDSLYAAALAFTEARLLAYPVRSLNRPFVHITCPLILARLERDLGVMGLLDEDQRKRFAEIAETAARMGNEGAAILSSAEVQGALVVEDLVYRESMLERCAALQILVDWCPDEFGKKQMAAGLTLLADNDYAYLVKRAIPVVARTQLTDGKTTDTWVNPEDPNDTQKGNLWYEEQLPPDCLFASFIGQRRRVQLQGRYEAASAQGLALVAQHWGQKTSDSLSPERIVQIGGNETVGQGLCTWQWHRFSETRDNPEARS